MLEFKLEEEEEVGVVGPLVRGLVGRVKMEEGRRGEERRGRIGGADRSCLYKVLQIVEMVAKESEYISKHPEVAEPLYDIADLLQYSKEIDYEDNICRILGYIFKSRDILQDR